ncbi:Replication protein A 32 kDa subunit B [Astathelohania contejeani]|uniref:Replication protein A 32 kDa subunit B n=1 Tax=Astathelohania contejeani TaxID=164912 RepID=A0ABQ7HYD7_9MICR|nr:Replication protein A 32 kDa subunit B [Thelohania contejeani]
MYSDDNNGFIPTSSPRREISNVKTTRNLTTKQLISYELDQSSTIHLVDEHEISTIVVIGWVREPKYSQNGTVFMLDDGTDEIEATFWPNGTYEEEQGGLLEEGNLILIIGSMRVFNNKKNINVSYLEVLEDPNAFTYHFLSCIYQHLHFTNNLVKEKQTTFTKIQEDILECYRKNDDPQGLNAGIVIRMLASKYKEEDIKQNIEELLNSLHLYSVDGEDYRISRINK